MASGETTARTRRHTGQDGLGIVQMATRMPMRGSHRKLFLPPERRGIV